MAKPNKGINRRKKKGNRKPFLTLAIIILLIVIVFYLLEKARQSLPVKTSESPKISEKLKIPPRITSPEVQQRVSSAVIVPLLPKPKVREAGIGSGSVAIIVDDMGSSMQEIKSLLAIELPITFSIIPSLAKARGVAEAAHSAGREVMVHIPMEPLGYPKQRMEQNGLLVALSEGEIEGRVNGFLQEVPFAVGANNHMGSRFTQYETKMQPVLRVLKERDLFFIDSMTSPASVGYKLARNMGLKAGVRQVFLDNVQDIVAIKAQLEQVAGIARKKGGAIAICHPHKTTIQALTEMMPVLKKAGITFVYASQLVG